MSFTAATCGTNHNFSASSEDNNALSATCHLVPVASNATSTISTLDLTRSISTATSYSATSSTADYLCDLAAEDLPFRDSLEFARQAMAESRERKRIARNAAFSVGLPANVVSADVNNAAGITTGTALARNNNNARPHYVWHKNSFDLPRARLIQENAAARSAHALKFKQRFCARARALAGAALARVTCSRVPSGDMIDIDISVNGRPIEIIRSSGHKMCSRDYDAYEYASCTRLEYLERLATADGFSDLATWCLLESIRL